MTHREAVRALILTPARELLLLKSACRRSPSHFGLHRAVVLNQANWQRMAFAVNFKKKSVFQTSSLGPWCGGVSIRSRSKGVESVRGSPDYIVHAGRFQPRMSDVVESEFVLEFRWWPVSSLCRTSERLTPLILARIVEKFLAEGRRGRRRTSTCWWTEQSGRLRR